MDKNNDFVSNVKTIPFSQQTVYDKLADLSNMEKIRRRMDDPAFIQKIEDKVGPEKLQQLRGHISSVQFTQDSMTADMQMGHISVNVMEREAPKCVKYEAQGAPVGLLMWIQLMPVDEMSCKMRLTVRADLNMFIRKMVEGRLSQGVEQLADMLAQIPYGAL